MFESVLKTSCEIIQFGWNKDRSPVDTFIMGFPICERNGYEEEVSLSCRLPGSLSNLHMLIIN